MTIEVEVFGNEQIPKHKSNVIEYSYSEDSTPVIPGDSSGGVGSLSFSTLDDAQSSILFYKDEVHLVDTHNGSITGTVSGISASDGVVGYSGVSNLIRLNVSRKIPYINGTVGEIVSYIFAEAGIVTGFTIDDDIDVIPAICPEFDGDLWLLLKDLCSVYEFEISLLDDIITVRKLRERTIRLFDVISDSWSVGDINPAQTIEVNYYNYEENLDALVYPKGGWNKDVQVYQVDANQVLEFDIELDVFLSFIIAPTVETTVGRYDDADSVYCVAGNDGLPIAPALWTGYGGSLVAEIDPERSNIIHVTVTGANLPDYGPFRIGVSSGPSDYYSSLRIRGGGLFYEKKTISQPTGLSEEDTPNLVGITIDNRNVSTLEQARDVAKRAAVPYGMPKVSYSFSAPNIGDFLTAPGQIVYTRFFEYDNQIGDIDFTEEDASIGTWSFEDFDENLPSSVVDGTEFQMFGNVNGARVKYRDSWYRVRSATITPTTVDASADWDNMFSDVNTVNAGNTFADFNGTFAQPMTFTDFHLIPLRSA